jgi:hypothetical protein
LIFIVMPMVIPICLFTGVARTLIAGSHSPEPSWSSWPSTAAVDINRGRPVWRHVAQFQRLRMDLQADDL